MWENQFLNCLFIFFLCVCVVFICVHLCRRVHTPVGRPEADVKYPAPSLSTLISDTESLTIWGRLVDPYTCRIYLSHPTALGLQVEITKPSFYMVAGIQTQVLILAN